MKVWTFQDHRQKQKLGAKAPWSVGWVDPEEKRRSKRVGLKSAAEKYLRKVEGELAAGVYENKSRKQWSDFRAEFRPPGRQSRAIVLGTISNCLVVPPTDFEKVKIGTSL